jgi:hypothetical protein
MLEDDHQEEQVPEVIVQDPLTTPLLSDADDIEGPYAHLKFNSRSSSSRRGRIARMNGSQRLSFVAVIVGSFMVWIGVSLIQNQLHPILSNTTNSNVTSDVYPSPAAIGVTASGGALVLAWVLLMLQYSIANCSVEFVLLCSKNVLGPFGALMLTLFGWIALAVGSSYWNLLTSIGLGMLAVALICDLVLNSRWSQADADNFFSDMSAFGWQKVGVISASLYTAEQTGQYIFSFPTTYLVLPAAHCKQCKSTDPQESSHSFLSKCFGNPESWVRGNITIIFLCGKTLKQVKYGNSHGLHFTPPGKSNTAHGCVVPFCSCLFSSLWNCCRGDFSCPLSDPTGPSPASFWCTFGPGILSSAKAALKKQEELHPPLLRKTKKKEEELLSLDSVLPSGTQGITTRDFLIWYTTTVESTLKIAERQAGGGTGPEADGLNRNFGGWKPGVLDAAQSSRLLRWDVVGFDADLLAQHGVFRGAAGANANVWAQISQPLFDEATEVDEEGILKRLAGTMEPSVHSGSGMPTGTSSVEAVRVLVLARLQSVRKKFPTATDDEVFQALQCYSPESFLFEKQHASSDIFSDGQWEKYQGELNYGSDQQFFDGIGSVLGHQIQTSNVMALIVSEILGHGSDASDDRYNFWYIYYCKAVAQKAFSEKGKARVELDKTTPKALLDEGHDGWRLQDFVDSVNYKLRQSGSKLRVQTAHVLALRLYTASSFRQFNRALREQGMGKNAARGYIPFHTCIQNARECLVQMQAIPRPSVNTYRGCTGFISDTFTDSTMGMEYAFFSTAAVQEVATDFLQGADRTVLFEVSRVQLICKAIVTAVTIV